MPADARLAALSSELVINAGRLVRSLRQRRRLSAGFRVLSTLDQFGPLGVTRLAEIDQCSQPTMSGLVSGLVDRGLVVKAPHPDDARASVVSLTDAGREELRATRAANADVVAHLVAASGHTADDVAIAVAVLRDLLDQQDAEHAATPGTPLQPVTAGTPAPTQEGPR
ncbi:MarR family winged helix-turn-helix transcriptional regulator [Nocardioides sp. TRM66260-LWL]|uniref:MarR family winged helix-turn-helix transcriptional regulator n=1 Tax=Nocardioides sp. TRM66260-LWL TaxID=2874478 RepID=UPI001CC53A05|nr:MarR family winged helix-turn-helix transcriptional regulator [Nocardioides sp. TRM66260-LWL]MBZ5732934.1 MarR family winged helix-turn-helix transcriptional regulator [Nocardioides sp. TRM66260-LWL]